MMSLVAYDASSDEESDNEEGNISKFIHAEKMTKTDAIIQKPDVAEIKGHISDDDDFIPSAEQIINKDFTSISKRLPEPKNITNKEDILEKSAKPTFTTLPSPKTVSSQLDIEEDDEFLHKKPKEEIIEKPRNNIVIKKMPVKIVIPSLKNFQDVEKEVSNKARNKTSSRVKSSHISGLLSVLPRAKSEQIFSKVNNIVDGETKNTSNISYVESAIHAFVPDTVKHRRPATNTEDVDRLKTKKKKLANPTNNAPALRNKSTGSDESGDEDKHDLVAGDFFSFNADKSLPEVSVVEINTLVAKKAAKMVETAANYMKATEAEISNEVEQIDIQEVEASRKRYLQEDQFNPEALEAILGGRAKRRHKQTDIQVIDINSSQVMPSKDEWMRTALASSTAYQPTGVLVDEEPASGTRRKHQITYLAHKAKANEAELQAMWSANRQNRRATQNKYGF